MTITVGSELAHQFDDYPYIIGIAFGAKNSGVSVAHKNDYSSIYTLKKWAMNYPHSNKPSSQIYTSIIYKDGDRNNALIGVVKEDALVRIYDSDKYLVDLKQALFGHFPEYMQPLDLPEGLEIQDVVADYLKQLITLAIKSLMEDQDFIKSIKNFKDEFEEKNFRYSLACPKSQEEVMGACLVNAGIIKEEELESRLSFVSESEAISCSYLALERQLTKLNAGDKHIVCDVGHNALRISKITADTTDFFSKVETVPEYPPLGSVGLDIALRRYLQENSAELKLNENIIDIVFQEFVDNFKFTFSEIGGTLENAFNTKNTDGGDIQISHHDLSEHVFLPYIEKLVDRILESDDGAYKQIFFSGHFSISSYFIDKFEEKNKSKLKTIKNISEKKFPVQDFVSRGAILHAFREKGSQIPYYLHDGPPSQTKTDSTDSCINQKKGGTDDKICDFVVGIDFGTTYSGCSYAKYEHPPKKGNIKVIKSWPGRSNNMLGKTPTLLVFDTKRNTMNPGKWGQLAQDGTLEDFEILFNKFKLFLSPESATEFYGTGTDALNKIYDENRYKEYNIVEIIAKYLGLVKEYVESHIKKLEGNNKWKFKYVITVPAMWDDAAKNTMAQAAVTAGMVDKRDLDNLLIITEPEAAALHCESTYTEFIDRKKDGGTRFIVCDAGGGTVDLVTFRLVDVEGKPNIEQLGDGTGDLCGSTYLDKNFKNYLTGFYDEIQYDYQGAVDFSDLMTTFETDWKLKFKTPSNGDSCIDINIPGPGISPSVQSTEKYTLSRGNTVIMMKKKDMMTIVFDPIVEKIEDLIQQQIDQSGGNIDTILLVGGFCENEYLKDRLRKRFESPATAVLSPADRFTAISQGAVSYGLNPRMITKRLVRQSYALEVMSPLDKEREDGLKEQENGVNHTEKPRSRLVYFVKRNDPVEKIKRSIFEKTIYVEYPNNAIIAVFACDDIADEIKDGRWSYVNSGHNKIMELNIVMPKVPAMNAKDKIKFKVSLFVDHIGVTVKVACEDSDINVESTRRGMALEFVRKSAPLLVENDKRPVKSWWSRWFLLNN